LTHDTNGSDNKYVGKMRKDISTAHFYNKISESSITLHSALTGN